MAEKNMAQILLEEFGEICAKNNIEYQVAWGPEVIGSGVIMSTRNFTRFREATLAETKAKRKIECWDNSPSYPDETARYVATDSLGYNILDFTNYRYHGVFVEINILRDSDETLSGKQNKVIESMLKRSAYSFVGKKAGKHESMQEILYKGALKKAGGKSELKAKVFADIISGTDVSLNSKMAAKFKAKKYTKDYIDSCVVIEGVDSEALFNDESFVNTLKSNLDEGRQIRKDIERHKKSGKDSMKYAENVWKTVCQIDEIISNNISFNLDDVQAKQFEILCKLHKVCEDNSIGMMLSGDTVLAAYRDKCLSDNISIAVDASDVKKLISVIETLDDKHLGIDAIRQSGASALYCLHVYDPATIDFNASNYHRHEHNCLHVTVDIIENTPSSTVERKLTSFKKNINRVEEKIKRTANDNYSTAGTIAPADKAFESHLKTYSGNSKNVKVNGSSFAKSMFKNNSPLIIGGVVFNAPEKIEDYLKKLYGVNWINAKTEAYIETEQRFRDANFSWEEYKLRIDGLMPDDYMSNLKKSNKLGKEHRKYHEKIVKYYDVLRRTDARFKLWEKYEPEKARIMDLCENENYEELEAILGDYIDAIGTFANAGLGLCFDPDIFRAAKAVLINNGQEELAEYAENLIPEEHRGMLRLKDYKGNYIN